MSSDFDGHTPAPWSYEMSRSGQNFKLSNAAGDVVVDGYGCCGSPDMSGNGADVAHANARLIAAAPDLLAERDRLAEVNAELVEALETTLAVYVLTALYDRDRGRDVSTEEHVIAARAALAKARGQGNE